VIFVTSELVNSVHVSGVAVMVVFWAMSVPPRDIELSHDVRGVWVLDIGGLYPMAKLFSANQGPLPLLSKGMRGLWPTRK